MEEMGQWRGKGDLQLAKKGTEGKEVMEADG